MARDWLPMFPLGTVLMPGGVLPLHIFEPRYRELVHACQELPVPEFGVVLIARGSEVGGGDVRHDVGVIARMLDIQESPDGRFAVMSVGTRRCRVEAWLPDDPYPLAVVVEWPDDPDIMPPELIDEMTAEVRDVVAMAQRLGGPLIDPDFELSADPSLASFQLCTLAPIGPADAYRLLCARTPRQRLLGLRQFLGETRAALEFRLANGNDD